MQKCNNLNYLIVKKIVLFDQQLLPFATLVFRYVFGPQGDNYS